MVVALWSFAVYLASVFAALITGITLVPKVNGRTRALVWSVTAAICYVLTYISYSINLYNDLFGILGLSAVVCLIPQFLYKGTMSTKLMVSLMSCLLANVLTFMLCGTTDTLAAPALGLIKESPYDVPNLLFFIGIKLVVYSLFTLIYVKYVRKNIHSTIETFEGKTTIFVAPLLISVVGFYVINWISNSNGIYPSNPWFFPLYITICAMFLVEFSMIFHSINQSVVAMKNAAELNVATNIQQSMLPCIFPAFPDREDFDIFASMDPAKEVGGDFYDFFMVDEDNLAIVMADVSGKGVPAALFMVIGKTLLKDHTMQKREDLSSVFSEVNNLLCEANSEGLFITAFEGLLNLRTGEFTYVNAGHEPPFIYRKGGTFEAYKIPPCFVLAGMEEMEYKSGKIQLEPGDKLFQYTDGVTEATNAKNELYGMERLSKVLTSNKNAAPEQILKAVKTDIDEFVGTAPQFDDITMLCVEYKGK